jgi:hypothetical protein
MTAAEPTTMIAAFFSTVSPEGWSSFRLALRGAVPAGRNVSDRSVDNKLSTTIECTPEKVITHSG